MDHFIDHIEIKNFKSIRHLNVDGFKRINLFIGRPNVGKSNILEALSMFSLPYVWEGSKKLTDLVRLENSREIFYNVDLDNGTGVGLKQTNGNIRECHISYNREISSLMIRILDVVVRDKHKSNSTRYFFSTDGKLQLKKKSKEVMTNMRDTVKKYDFRVSSKPQETEHSFLQSPFGSNLLYVLELMPELRKEYAQWFRQYGLRLVLDTATQSLKVQKDKSEDEVFQLPYSSVADTLQRIIFYKTAVASNQNSVLLFEEPEAHAYPPYIVEFTQEVIRSLTNQFFVVTHSPLIVEEFLTDAIDDLGIFLVDFKDGQTSVRPLTTDEIYEVRKYGIDLFFNNEAYLA